MSLRQLKWTTIIAPLVFLATVDFIRHAVDPGLLHAWPGTILIAGVGLFAVLLFSETIFGRIARMQVRLAQQNRELLALHEAGLDVAGELSLELVLQKVVDHARELIGARYGALAVPIVSGGHILGNLYLAEKAGNSAFSREDEDTLARFATQAALAIENARLHRRVRELAVTQERERIAREMHDSLAQVLGSVNTKAQAVQELLKGGQVERTEVQVGQLGEAARSAYADVREGILGLRTSVGPQRGLLEALEEYLERWQEQSGVEARLRVEPTGAGLEGLTPAAELQLLRIVQEALANVRKHAGASHVEVGVDTRAETVQTVVADDGQGFDPRQGRAGGDRLPHFGLSTMRERAESVGGTLEVHSAPGAGTRVVVRVPARRASGPGRPSRVPGS